MGDLDDRLTVAYLRRMDRRIEKVEGNSLPGQLLRPLLSEFPRVGQLMVDRDELLESDQVGARAELHQDVRMTVGRRAPDLVFDPV